MDVKFTFLNKELTEEVYIRQPPRFIIDGQEDKVMCLDKALYGFHQAPHAWNVKLNETLVALGFSHSVSEHAVYAWGEGTSGLLVGVYVDDLVITGSAATEIGSFKRQMSGCSRAATASTFVRRHMRARSWSMPGWWAATHAPLPWKHA
jgi:hypothetical protein